MQPKNGRNNFLVHKKHKCRHCSKYVSSRFDFLIHEAKHLRIPCLSNFYKCTCRKYFLSGEALQLHNEKDHLINVPEINFDKGLLQTILIDSNNSTTETQKQETVEKVNIKVKIESFSENKLIVSECNSDVGIVKNIKEEIEIINEMDKPSIVIDSDRASVSQSDLRLCKKEMNFNSFKFWKEEVDHGVFTPMTAKIDDDDNNVFEGAVVDWSDCLTENASQNDKEMYEPDSTTADKILTNSLRSKLVFEDDSDEDLILKYEEDEPADRGKNDKKNSDDAKTVGKDILKPISTPALSNAEVKFATSVNYDQLLLPGIFACKQCNKLFLNRYDLILHETTHLKIRQRNRLQLCSICDYYIAGNYIMLRKHYEKKHPGVQRKTSNNLRRCNTCQLKYYSFDRHVINYHSIFICPHCTSRFDNVDSHSAHVKICNGLKDYQTPTVSRILKVCELCSLFFKNTEKLRYKHMGVHAEKGGRITCERCDKKFFEVKLVQMTRKEQHERSKVKKEPVSNASRLRNIRQRIKMYNKMLKI